MKTEVAPYQTLVHSIKPLVERKEGKGKDFWLSCRIGGKQTVQNYEHSPTCCVQFSLSHPTLVHLRVSLVPSIQHMLSKKSRNLVTCRSESQVCSQFFSKSCFSVNGIMTSIHKVSRRQFEDYHQPW
jgi:hypothetical protein